MTKKKTLLWLSSGPHKPPTDEPFLRPWELVHFDITHPPGRRSPTLPPVRVGVLDFTHHSQTIPPLHLDSWIEALTPTAWVGLLPYAPHSDVELSDIVASFCVDYHTQPYDCARLDNALGHLWGMAELQHQLQTEDPGQFEHHALDGHSPAIRQTRALLKRFAHTDEPVLIHGDSGTGKGAAARFLHDHSTVAQGPYITVNCAALPINLTQSELFGYEKGAFTHAMSARAGRIEKADGGTLVFSGIDELKPEQQSALLRFLQEGLIERVGSHQPRKIRARIVATSSLLLKDLVTLGQFRGDIYYRLGSLQVRMPRLSERLDDIPLLAEIVLRSVRRFATTRPKTLCAAATRCLFLYPWPGNLREFHNRIRQAALLSEAPQLTPADLGLADLDPDQPHVQALSLETFRARAEQEAIAYCLNLSNNNVSAAARLLKISRLSLYRLMDKHRQDLQTPSVQSSSASHSPINKGESS
ncbi:MAG: AAA family ATPase [Alteromonadaceae bacterium]|nr:AAA family ATPase [Alteromonadaceae bacterium]